jgi:hypothetical protein
MSIQLLRDEDVIQVVGGLLDASATLIDASATLTDVGTVGVPIAEGGGGDLSPVTFNLDGKPVSVETPQGLLAIGPPDFRRIRV